MFPSMQSQMSFSGSYFLICVLL